MELCQSLFKESRNPESIRDNSLLQSQHRLKLFPKSSVIKGLSSQLENLKR